MPTWRRMNGLRCMLVVAVLCTGCKFDRSGIGLDGNGAPTPDSTGPDAVPGIDTSPGTPDALVVDAPQMDAPPTNPDAPNFADAGSCAVGCGNSCTLGGCCDDNTCDQSPCTCMANCGCSFDCSNTNSSCTPLCSNGVACNVDCTGNSSGSCGALCDTQTRCAIDCSNTPSDCGATCLDNSTCDLDCQGASVCNLVLCSSSTCNVDCRMAADCTTSCVNSTCDIDCRQANACSMACTGGSCLLNCNGATTCGFSFCDTVPELCPGGIIVCNRECP